jgi:hypothetical protein
MKLMTLLLSSLGTGKQYRNMLFILSPSFEVKLSKTKCGYCSETVEEEKLGVSWRRATLCKVNKTVGP